MPTNEVLIPYVWLREARSDDVVAAFGDNPEVRRLELIGEAGRRGIDEVDEEYLLRVE